MIKKCVISIIVVGVAVGSLYAADKKDTSTSNAPIITHQAANKSLDKQTRILPKPQSSWSKIKELFM